MSAAVWAGVCGLGGIGAVLRVVVAREIARRPGAGPVLGTLVVNLSGAFLLGVLSGAGVEGDARLLAGTALLGSYTTFSTWVAEIEALRPWPRAAGFAAATLVLGLLAVLLGRAVG